MTKEESLNNFQTLNCFIESGYFLFTAINWKIRFLFLIDIISILQQTV